MTNSDVLAAVTALLGATMAGVYFGFSLLVMPGLHRRPAAEALTAMQSINGSVRWLFLLVFGGSSAAALTSIIIEAVGWDPTVSAWRLIGSVLVLLHFAITAAFHIPRNTRIDRLDPQRGDDLAEWRTLSTQWTVGNHVRGLSAFIGAAILLATLL